VVDELEVFLLLYDPIAAYVAPMQEEFLLLLEFLALLVHRQAVVHPVPLVYLWEVSVYLPSPAIVDLAI
jgi:hypothetical protein